jgi:hypothetical protein
MLPSRLRQTLSVLTAALLLSSPIFAFDSPLSSEAVREAYFLGQRHDESMARYLDQYTAHLDAPKNGPYISSVEFLTPFAQLIRSSSQHSLGYSAQQAEQEHRGQPEVVEISVEIQLTDSYGPLLTRPAAPRSTATTGYRLRSPDFWHDFQVHVIQRDKELEPAHFGGEPNYYCVDRGCTLSGATIYLDFPARTFDGDTATIEVDPPVGEAVTVDFDLTRLR